MDMERLTMIDACRLLGVNVDTNRRDAYIPCPICAKNSRDKKLNINFTGGNSGEGVYRCNRCGDLSGGPLSFWALMRGLDRTDLKEARKDWLNTVGSNNVPKIKESHKEEEKKYVDTPIADLTVRSNTYSKLLSMLTLSDQHHKNLSDRGLSHPTILRNDYKTYPQEKHDEIAIYLLNHGCILEGVPGFFRKEDGTWTLKKIKGSGFLIPQRNGYGQIQSFQIRYDEKKNPDDQRYKYLSSAGYNMGTPTHSYIHMRIGPLGLKEAILTEGALKADVISELTGYSVIAVPGVNSLSLLPPALIDLKRRGLEKISLAYDMDKRENIHVQKAEEKLKKILYDLELPYSTLEWNENYKGLDDFLSSKVGKEV